MTKNPTTELMELVLAKIGGVYLSDLHDRARAADVRQAVLAIPAESYPAEAWSALADYIIREKIPCASTEQAVGLLVAHLDRSAG